MFSKSGNISIMKARCILTNLSGKRAVISFKYVIGQRTERSAAAPTISTISGWVKAAREMIVPY